MSTISKAAALDAAEKPVEAARAYEDVLSKGDRNVETYLNLAVLYFQCTDFGYMSHHGLSEEFCQKASKRARELLDEAEDRFGSQNELSFWRYYFDYAELGEPADPSRVEELLQEGPSRVPVFHLLMLQGEGPYIAEGEALLREMSPPQTERERYVVSVLRSVLSEAVSGKGTPGEG